MSYLFLYLDQLRNLGSLVIAELLLVWSNIPEKKNGRIRLAVLLIMFCCLTSVYLGLYRYFYDYIGWISIAWYFTINILAGVMIGSCFEIKYSSLIWVMLSAYAAQHCVYIILNEMIFQGVLRGAGNQWLELFCYCVMCVVAYTLFHRIFRANIRYLDRFFPSESKRERIIITVFYLVFIISTYVNQLNAVNDDFNYLSCVSDLFSCVFVLVTQFIMLHASRIQSEKYVADRLFLEEKRQYENFKRSVDYINIKCHDLKHEIARMRRMGYVDANRVDKVASELQLYDAFAKTGNETLDLLLTDKNLICLSKGITLSYMADASGLGFMDEGDIYSLFGNMLDNSIEYLERIEDEQNRFIRFFIKRKGDMLFVHAENYFTGNLELSEGLPVTTKKDTVFHGFGTKSMRTTVEKYGGSFKITPGNGLFAVDFYFPIQ